MARAWRIGMATEPHKLPGTSMVSDGQLEPQRRSGIMISLIVFGIYLILPTREFYWDGVGFALAVETPPVSPDSLLFPNHLLYNLMGYAVWKVAAAAGASWRALYVFQALNSLFGAAGVYLVWRIAAELTRSAGISAWSALLFAFAAQWWRFSTDANAYIPSIFFLLVSFRLMLPGTRSRPFAVGLAHGGAMLLHQLALFFFPVAIAGLLHFHRDQRSKAGKLHRLMTAGKYGATAAAVTVAAYLTAFSLVRPTLDSHELWKWITAHAEDAVFWLSPAHSLRYSLRGTMRLFFGGRVNQLHLDVITVAGALAFVSVLALSVRFLILTLQRPAANGSSPPAPSGFRAWFAGSALMILWILSYFIFLIFWQPQNTFYRLFYLPPLVLLISTLPAWRRRWIQGLALIVGIVCTWNFTTYIYPDSREAANEVLSFAVKRQESWRQGSAILYARSHSDLWLIQYFNRQAAWIELPSPEIKQLEAHRVETELKGGTLWLEGTAYDAVAKVTGGRGWLDQHIDVPGSLIQISPSHRIRYFRIR
jgi:hypothetical protein